MPEENPQVSLYCRTSHNPMRTRPRSAGSFDSVPCYELGIGKNGEAVKPGELAVYHAEYFAHGLTRCFRPGSAEMQAGAVASSQVDLNPHQVDAALFALDSSFSKGSLLVDDVGLRKTIKLAKRETQIERVTDANGGEHGVLQGNAGKSLQEIQDLKSLAFSGLSLMSRSST